MIGPLHEADLDEARSVLAASCPFDQAAEVAGEKLFAPAPSGPAVAWGARENGRLVGVAAATGARLRLLAVHPDARGKGFGSALLAASGTRRTLDLPGNYLAPGIDVRNTEAIAWLERRGWRRLARVNENLRLDVRAVTAIPAPAGYEVRRAVDADRVGLCMAIALEFGGAWPFEVARAIEGGGVFVATAGGAWAGFAAHDGNNQGLGWFGPAGTWPAHRGKKVGEALLLACLAEVARTHDVCEVAWIGPRAFYERAAPVLETRQFAVLKADPP